MCFDWYIKVYRCVFHCEIVEDAEKVKQEEKAYKKIPIITDFTDEEGNDIELEYIDALEHNGTTYMAFFPVVEEGEEENEDEYGLIILKSETVDGEEMLANVVDEDEINEVYDLFMEQMMEDEEE